MNKVAIGVLKKTGDWALITVLLTDLDKGVPPPKLFVYQTNIEFLKMTKHGRYLYKQVPE